MAISEEIIIKVNAVEAATSVKELRKALADARKAMAEAEIGSDDFKVATEAVEKAQRQLANVTKIGAKEVTAADQSYNALSRRLSELKQAYHDAQTAAQRADLAPEIRKITDQLKQMDADVGVFSRNVGDYFNQITDPLSKLFPQLAAARSGFDQLSGAVAMVKGNAVEAAKNMTEATTATGKLSGAFKLLKVAIASTGIGLLVVALGSLYTWLNRSQEGMEFLNRAMAVVGATVDVVLDRITQLGGAVFKLLKGDWQGAWASAKTAVQGVTEEIVKDVQQADKLAQRLIDIEKQELGLRARRAAEKVAIAELRTIANDTTKSYEERIKAQERANAISLRTAADEKRLGEERIANLLGELSVTEKVRDVLQQLATGADADSIISNLGLSESTIKDYEQLIATFESYNNKVLEFQNMQTEGVAKVNSLRKEQTAALASELESIEKEMDAVTSAMDKELEDGFAKIKKATEEYHADMLKSNGKFIDEWAKQQGAAVVADEKAQKKAAKEKVALEKWVKDEKFKLAIDITSSAADLLGRETEAGKAFAVASTTIATYQSATEAYKSLAGIPIVGPALAAAAAAAAVASGLANVKSILSVDTSGNMATMPSAPSAGIRTSAPAIIQQVPVTRTLTGAKEEATLNAIMNNTSQTANSTSSPMRAYVVLSDLEGKQKYANQTASEASF